MKIWVLCVAGLLVGCSAKSQEDEAILQSFLRQRQTDVDACFQNHLEMQPGKTYELRLSARHLRSGEFEEIELLEGDPKVARCVATHLSSTRSLPTSREATTELYWKFENRAEHEVGTRDLKEFQADFDSCFQAARGRLPGGLLRLQVRVNEDGKVEQLEELTGFHGSDQIVGCLEQRAKAWNFGQLESPSTQVWSWNFKSSLN